MKGRDATTKWIGMKGEVCDDHWFDRAQSRVIGDTPHVIFLDVVWLHSQISSQFIHTGAQHSCMAEKEEAAAAQILRRSLQEW